jgi:hypothetical protein
VVLCNELEALFGDREVALAGIACDKDCTQSKELALSAAKEAEAERARAQAEKDRVPARRGGACGTMLPVTSLLR